ncbi:MAG TPA: efflux RND transporter permease subunit [Sedimentibacter sp.]|nr:efflux RND transporter permease subunit [Sedimentibacter sp.]
MLAKFSVKKPVTITMIILMMIVIGAVSYSKLQIDLLPQMDLPYVMVQTSYQGAGPEEIENIISRPLEQTLSTVENIEDIISISSEGSSLILMQFAFNTDMDEIMLQIRERIDIIKGYLPEGTSSPLALKLDPNAIPIVQLAVSSKGDLYTTQKIAEDVIAPRFERIEGTASASVTGGLEQEVEIVLKEEMIKGYNLSSSYVAQILAAENLNMPGGTVKKGTNELTVRTTGEFKSLEEIKSLPIPLPTGGTIRLKDIADVSLRNKDQSSITKLNGKEVVQISVMKQSDANTVNVARSIDKEIEKLKAEYPDLELVTVFNQADYINLAIDNLIKTATQGGILAILILLVFLRSFKTTLVIAISIPFSIITTFVMLFFAGITLNMMTLGAFALAVGMLVDNSIVVLENIYRNRSLGLDRITASVDGTNEVAMAVTASTLTTIAVFLPIVFTGGLAAILFKEFALTITIALLSSLVIALTLVPMLSSKLISVRNLESEEEQEKKHGPIVVFYKKILGYSLRHRFLTIVLSIALFVVSVLMVYTVGAEFFPATDEGMINISADLPAGSEIEDIDALLEEIKEAISGIPEIETVFSSAGGGQMYGLGSSSSGSVVVLLKSLDERDRSAKEISDEIRSLTRDIPGAEISVSESSTMMMGMTTGAISITIKGDDMDTLKTIGDDFKRIIERVEGTREVTTSYEDGIPQVQIITDRAIASQYGLTTAQIGSSIANALSGSKVTTYKINGDEIDVVLKADNVYGESISYLEMLPIQTPMGSTVPLTEVADIKVEKGPISIQRENQVRVLTVSGSVVGRDIQSASNEIEELLKDYEMPLGYSYVFGGEIEQIEETFRDLFLVMLLAIALVYMIIAAQFESLIQPLSIMFSVPLALSGGFIALFVTGLPLNVIGIIGLIILVGIVVNNAIVLVDYINKRRRRGEDRNLAIMKAGPIRIRPIMMTALTTILGLVPMSLGLGEGAELSQSMGVVVIGGLSLSTVLTLVIVPVMYTIFDDMTEFFKRKIKKDRITEITG